ncbi:MAG: hypothetical protein AAGF95_06195 [Chloroflexota bacterium]
MKENIAFHYLYRDGANYKTWNYIVFTNPSEMDIKAVEERLRNAFESKELFIADQVRVPEVFSYLQSTVTHDDHCYHEFASLEVIEEPNNDLYSRPILGFVEEVEQQSRKGWRAFDPQDKV